MAQRPNIPQRQSGKPSKLLTAMALIVTFSLPYFLVTHFAVKKTNNYTKHSVLLPKPIPLASPSHLK